MCDLLLVYLLGKNSELFLKLGDYITQVFALCWFYSPKFCLSIMYDKGERNSGLLKALS